jgi:hypothetical protein
MNEQQCEYCRKFFERYSCGKKWIGECDCPKCQGYCKCKEKDDDRVQVQDKAL